jgi:type I restriction enzyme S subunit
MSLPSGWKKVKLGDVVKMSSGGTPSKDNASFWNGDIPWISALEMHKNYVEEAKLSITEEALKKGSSLAKKNDLLLLTRGSMLWKRIPVCLCLRDVAFNQDVKCLHTNERLNSTFLLYWFGCMEPKIMHMVVGTGIGAGKLESRGILDLDINLPPIEEQKKIAATLSVWDSAIEKMEKFIDAKEDQKKSLIWKLIESNDNRKIKLGKVVVDKNKWRKSKLSDVASGFDYGMNAAAKEYDGKNKYIRITDIDDVSHKFNSIDLVSPNAELEDKYRVNEGDILFARTGASTGKSYLYDKNDGVLYFAGFLIRVHVLKDDPFFIYVQTLSLKYQNWLKKMSMRSGQPGVNAEEYKNLPILVPTLLEQNAITEVLSAAEKELSLLKQQLENYKKQKQGLMQKLLTGQWRVK